MESLGGSSGGIQWNASNKYIQLLSSDGSTWINWKYYDPTRSFEIVASNSGYTPTLTYTCEYNGYYAAVAASYSDQRINPPTSTGTLMYSRYPGSSANQVAIFNCTVGKTITIYGNNYSCQPVLYIGSGYSGVSVLSDSGNVTSGYATGSISSVKGLLIGIRVTTAGKNITSKSDNYKAVSVHANSGDVDCILSYQTETITLQEQSGGGTPQSCVLAFQLT